MAFACHAGAPQNEASGEAGGQEQIVVTATRLRTLLSEAPGVIQVIARKEIEELRPPSTGKLLEYVTGTTIETGTGSGFPKRSVVGLNGLPPYYTLVLVDGVRLLSEHIHTGQNLDQIPPEAIERIEIIRGAATAQYGSDAIGGVINIITRRPGRKPELRLGGSVASYDTLEGGLGLLAPIHRDLGLSLFAHTESSDGLPIKAPAHRVGQMGYEKNMALARIEGQIPSSVRFFGWFDGVDNMMEWAGGDARSELRTYVAGATAPLGPDAEVLLQASYSKWEAEVSTEHNELFEPEARLTWHIAEPHTLIAGVDFRHQKFGRSADEGLPEQRTLGLYLQHQWDVTRQLTLMGALRYDHVEDVESVLSPMVSFVYSPDLPLRLRGSLARGFRAPTPQELHEEGYGHGGRARRFGNPDLEPEHSTSATLTLEVFPTERLELSLTGYATRVRDMIAPVYEGPWDVDPQFDVWRRTNISEAEVRGAEVRARYRLTANLRLEAGYTHNRTSDEESGRPLPYDPGSSAFVKAVANGKLLGQWRWSAFVALRAVFDRSAWSWKPAPGAPPSDPSGLTTELDDYEKLDAGVSLSWKDRYSLYLNVYNILGQDIENLDDVYTVLDGEPRLAFGFSAKW